MAGSKRQNQRLLVLLFIGALLLNYPLLSLFSTPAYFLGTPVLYLYLFCVWGLFILLMALALRKRSARQNPRIQQ